MRVFSIGSDTGIHVSPCGDAVVEGLRDVALLEEICP